MLLSYLLCFCICIHFVFLLEVPHLPVTFKPREQAQEQLVAALLDSSGLHSTALTAPKSRVSSQGSKSRSCHCFFTILFHLCCLCFSNTVVEWARRWLQQQSLVIPELGVPLPWYAVSHLSSKSSGIVMLMFHQIIGLNLSQSPDLMSLQQR